MPTSRLCARRGSTRETHTRTAASCAQFSFCGLLWQHFRSNYACAPVSLLPLVSPSVWAAGRQVRVLHGHKEAEIVLYVKTWNSELLWTPTQLLQFLFSGSCFSVKLLFKTVQEVSISYLLEYEIFFPPQQCSCWRQISAVHSSKSLNC